MFIQLYKKGITGDNGQKFDSHKSNKDYLMCKKLQQI